MKNHGENLFLALSDFCGVVAPTDLYLFTFEGEYCQLNLDAISSSNASIALDTDNYYWGRYRSIFKVVGKVIPQSQ